MSALTPKADMFSVESDVCYVPYADIHFYLNAEPFVPALLAHFAKLLGSCCGLPGRPSEECLPNPYMWRKRRAAYRMEGTSEMKKYLLASVLLVGFAGSAYAMTGQFDNMCAWGLANHKDVQTDCSVNATIKGSTYCFSSQDAKSNFMKSPDANLKKAETFYKSEHKG
jgi:YHS domain-containing protein